MLPIVQSVKIPPVVNDEYAMINYMAERVTTWIFSRIMIEKSGNEGIGCPMMHEGFAIVIEFINACTRNWIGRILLMFIILCIRTDLNDHTERKNRECVKHM